MFFNSKSNMQWTRSLGAVLLLTTGMLLFGQRPDPRVYVGTGEAPLEAGSFFQDRKREEARLRAERLAIPNALRLALQTVLAGKALPEEKLAELARGLMENSPAVLSKEPEDVYFDGGVAHARVRVRVNLTAVREYLRDNGISLMEGSESKFRVWVLSYSVTGDDVPSDRSTPIVLRDEIRDERQNVQSGSFSNLNVGASSRSHSTSLQASKANSDRGNVAVQSSSSMDARRKDSASASAQSDVHAQGRGGSFGASGSTGAQAESEASIRARESSSGSANWDKRESAAIDARQASASSAYSKTANSGSQYSDTSTKYYRVTEYADPTKKGAEISNSVGQLFEATLKEAGVDVRTMNLPLSQLPVDVEVRQQYVLSEIQGIRMQENKPAPDDYVALVMNNLTNKSVSDQQRRFSSEVNYRIFRVRDQDILASGSKSTTSDFQISESDARSQATKLSLIDVRSQLPEAFRLKTQQLQNAEKEKVANLKGRYVIQVDGIQDRSVLSHLKSALRARGLKFESERLNQGQTERITITLDGRSPEEVKEILDENHPGLKPLDANNYEARVKAL